MTLPCIRTDAHPLGECADHAACDCGHQLAEHQPDDGTAYAGWCSGDCDCEGPTAAGKAIPNPPALWVASLESRSWSFTAYGTTAAHAKEAIRTLILEHTAATGADPDWAVGAIEDAAIERVYAGVGYRDHDALTYHVPSTAAEGVA